MHSSFAILILSCDKYADMWSGFFECFKKYFPTGDWLVYLGSNTTMSQEPSVKTLLSGDDQNWSTSYKNILEQIPEQKLFVILEDLYLASPVNKDDFYSIVKFMFDRDANHIRYWALPTPDVPTDNPLIGECLKGAPYRSTVCGFWDREYLLNLLIEGENPWNFEIMGSYRTAYSDGFYATKKPICEYKNMIEKGYWIPESLEWANLNNISIDFNVRPKLRGSNELISCLQMIYFSLMLKLPWKLRIKIMSNLRKALISY